MIRLLVPHHTRFQRQPTQSLKPPKNPPSGGFFRSGVFSDSSRFKGRVFLGKVATVKSPPLCCAPLRGRIGLRFNQQCQHTTAWWECHTTRTQPRFTRQLLREFWLRNRPLTQGPAALIAASGLVSDYGFKPLSGVL